MLGWGLRQTSSNDSGGGRSGNSRTRGTHRDGKRGVGGRGWPEREMMMMITITVILEGWKSRHALLPVHPIVAALADLSRMKSDMIKGISKLFSREDNRNLKTLLSQTRAHIFSRARRSLSIIFNTFLRARGKKEKKRISLRLEMQTIRRAEYYYRHREREKNSPLPLLPTNLRSLNLAT